jgi:hypothetical protein
MRSFPPLLLLLSVACGTPTALPHPGPAPAATPPDMQDTETCSAEYTAALRCQSRIEARRMAATRGLAARSRDTLLIRGTGGDTLRLVNVTSAPDRTIDYRYDRYLSDIGSHLVKLSYYEGGSWILVDARTTGQTQLIGPPVVSPRRTRFAAASLDLLAGYNPNGVQVWRLGEEAPRLEWGIDGGNQWGAAALKWVSEDALDFTRYNQANTPEAAITARRMRLTLFAEEVTIRSAPTR